VAAFFLSIYYDLFTPDLVNKILTNWGPITTTFHLTGFLLAIVLYFKALFFNKVNELFSSRILKGNPSGNLIVDIFYGYEMNPRLFDIVSTDVKFFLEGRALILWTTITWFFAYAQYLQVGHVTNTMVTAVLLHFFYVLHYFVYETNVLAMLDFTGDHMGWMLGWGNTGL